MVKANEIFHEQPTITDMKWGIFVNPSVKAKLEQKFAGRIMVTLGTFLAALADDAMVMITGEQAAELRKLGVHNGQEMLAVIKQAKETERELDDARTVDRKIHDRVEVGWGAGSMTDDTSIESHDLDLGDGHWIDWTQYKDVRCGGIITHTTAKTETGLCSGSFWIDGLRPPFSDRDVWTMTGTFECPTLAPSFLCHCGDHGFIREGKWVRA